MKQVSNVSGLERRVIYFLYGTGSRIESIVQKMECGENVIRRIIFEKYGEVKEKTLDVNIKSEINRDCLIIDLYENRYSAQQIAKLLNMTQANILDILVKNKLISKKQVRNYNYLKMQEMLTPALTERDLDNFRDNVVHIGDKFKLHITRESIHYNDIEHPGEHDIIVSVQKKYTHWVKTDKGSFIYFDLWAGTKITE